MPLARQQAPISLFKGIDTKTDYKQVVPGKLLSLTNGVFTTPGQLRKRYGHTAFTKNILGGGTLSSGYSIKSFLNELDILDGTFFYSYTPADTSWSVRGRLTTTSADYATIANSATTQISPAMAQHSSGMQIFTWSEPYTGNGTYYAIRDGNTGTLLVPRTQLTDSFLYTIPLAFQDSFVLITASSAAHASMEYTRIPISTLVAAAPVVLATDTQGSGSFEAIVNNNRIYVSYASTTVNTIKLFYLDSSFVQSAVTSVNTGVPVFYNTLWADTVNNQIWVGFIDSTTRFAYYFVRDAALTGAILVPTLVDNTAVIRGITGAAYNGSGQLWDFVSGGAGADSKAYTQTRTATNAGVLGTLSTVYRSVSIGSKAFVLNTKFYIFLQYTSLLQSTYFLVDSAGTILGHYLPGIASTSPNQQTIIYLPGVVTSGLSSFLFPMLKVNQLLTESGSTFTISGTELLSGTILPANSLFSISSQNNLLLTGANPSIYDGSMVVEQGFYFYPEDFGTISTSTVGGHLGSASVATTYEYMVTYEWQDAQGQTHYSTPSVPSNPANVTASFAMGVITGQVTLTIPTLRVSAKTNVFIQVYRTTGNGTIFYRLTNLLHQTAPLYNDPTTDTVTFNDTVADADIINNPVLYTTGGVLENTTIPPFSFVTSFQNRIVAISPEQPTSFFYSKTLTNTVPVEFTDAFVEQIDGRDGNITGAIQLDSYLVLFKQHLVFYVAGQGPNNTGGQNDFSLAQLITADAGCSEPRSIVMTAEGVMFKSLKGIYILRRNLQVEYIGADVEQYNSNTITSSQLIPKTNQVRFTLDNGTVLVYDYFVQQWGVFSNIAAVDSALYQNQFIYIDSAGLVLQENPSLFTDNGSFIPLAFTTSWLSLAQLQGFERLQRLLVIGEYKSSHHLVINTYYDFSLTPSQTDNIDATSLLSSYPPYEFRIDLARQKCTSVQFSVTDAQASNFGEGYSLSNLNLLVGVKQGSNKLPATQTFG